jgi:thioredoxin reductase (NADPH)
MPSLILYTRTGCSLCQAMEAQLARLSPEGLFTLTTIDLEDHPELESRYGEWVPVLMAGASELCHYHLDEAMLRDWLARQLPM